MELSRRRFLLGAGRCLVVTGALPLVSACENAERAGVEDPAELKVLEQELGPHLVDVLYHASLAPSGLNAQPWTVRIAKRNRWVIGSSSQRWLPAVDPNNRELLLSIGAFLENLILAAGTYSYGVQYRVIAKSPFDAELIELELERAPQAAFSLRRLRGRRTLRGGFEDRALSKADVFSLSEALSGVEYFARGGQDSAYLDEITLEANRAQYARDEAREELADWIRWSNGDARSHRTGLTPATMEMEGLDAWWVRTFYGRDSVLSEGFAEQGLEQVQQQLASHGGWLAVTSPDDSIASLIEAGRRFERLFLRVRERGVALHPMSQALEEAPWREQVAGELGTREAVQFLLRVGYRKDYPEPVSLRMPLAGFARKG